MQYLLLISLYSPIILPQLRVGSYIYFIIQNRMQIRMCSFSPFLFIYMRCSYQTEIEPKKVSKKVIVSSVHCNKSNKQTDYLHHDHWQKAPGIVFIKHLISFAAE